MKNKLKVLDIEVTEKPHLSRYEGSEPIPLYDDITQLWELENHCSIIYTVEYRGKIYRIIYDFLRHFFTDKCSTPLVRSHWYPAVPHELPHDTNFSNHFLKQFAINGDDGFRFTNMLFRECIDYKIRESLKDGKISRFKYAYWMIKKRVWYRSVGSIAGQGFYVNGDPRRGYHGKFSRCTIEVLS